ncbi:MAG: site-2 protease family protein [Planctomycetota bacterium]|nr:site-2 protease family protein [Planctomycetota bacterium]
MDAIAAVSGADVYVYTGVFLILVFAVVFHEVAHGFVAYLNGDPTAKMEGRLSLNPLAHLDPIGSVVVPLLTYYILKFPFGWARPVPVNPLNYRRRVLGDITVSLGGVTANFLFALALGALYHIAPRGSLNEAVLSVGIVLNCALFTFNLIPIPPLDGSHIFKYFLPKSLRLPYIRIGAFGFFILMLFMYVLQRHIAVGGGFGLIGYPVRVVLFLTGHGWGGGM